MSGAKRQKRIALVNDITGFGRCSVAVELPLISALKVQACALPTAILSCHTGFPTHYIDDYTDRMRPYMEDWQQNGVQFDGIATGFLGSAEQIAIVQDFIRTFKQPGTRVMVDPVMGDYGKLYASYTDEMCEKMKGLLGLADIVTPNLTEACRLLDRAYPKDGKVDEGELAVAAERPHAAADGEERVERALGAVLDPTVLALDVGDGPIDAALDGIGVDACIEQGLATVQARGALVDVLGLDGLICHGSLLFKTCAPRCFPQSRGAVVAMR